jgi:mevalonate kinase
MESPINWTAARFMLDIVILLGMIGIGIYTWWSNRTRASQVEFGQAHKRMDKILAQVNRLELEAKHVPTRAEFTDLNERLGELHADLREMIGGQETLKRLVDIMNQHLLAGGGGRR